MPRRRVVVTGLGAITPLGNNVPDYWAALLAGVSGAATITRFDASRFKATFACEVKGFDGDAHFGRKDARRMDLFTQFAMYAAAEAMKDAAFELEALDRSRCGVIWGSGIGGLRTLEEEIGAYVTGDGTPRFSPFLVPKMIIDIAAGMISMEYGFRGINYATVSACATSSHAMGDAFHHIRENRADVMICGGSEAPITFTSVGGFTAMKAMSERNSDPSTASRPYDKDRDGFVLGEGGAGIILEELEHAQRRGAKIYAELVGCGMTADAYHITAPHPEGIGAAAVMRMALEEAELQPEDIDYINTHGTSTPLGDGAELKAVAQVFGAHAYQLNVSATKSMTGHLLGAAGAVEAIAAILAVVNDVVPPTINHFTDDPELDPRINLTFHTAQQRTVRAALSNTFGFGGKNSAVIFKKF